MSTTRTPNISTRKQGVVESASFDTIVAAIVSKTERAQCTFMHRLLQRLGGEVLATTIKYAEAEVKRRVLTNVEPC